MTATTVATGRFGVEAGGRRWLAIGLLIQGKKLPPDVPVPCLKVEDDRATGVSLAENISQAPMHAADEFAAFTKLIAQGKTPEAVAAQFGVKVIDVQRRMKLANASPVLVAKFRDDKLTLDQMMAFASTDDQKRQLAVWKSMPECEPRSERRPVISAVLGGRTAKAARLCGGRWRSNWLGLERRASDVLGTLWAAAFHRGRVGCRCCYVSWAHGSPSCCDTLNTATACTSC